MINLKKELINTHIVLSHEDWANFKPLLVKSHISFEPSDYGKAVYIAFSNIDNKTFKTIGMLLKEI